MGTPFRERMTLVPVFQAFSSFVVHLYGGTSATWKEESLLPCNTPKEEHHPQSPALSMPQLDALYALRERILFDLKLGKQATAYKVALKALNRFIAELTTTTYS
jgi:hypothetical protein